MIITILTQELEWVSPADHRVDRRLLQGRDLTSPDVQGEGGERCGHPDHAHIALRPDALGQEAGHVIPPGPGRQVQVASLGGLLQVSPY